MGLQFGLKPGLPLNCNLAAIGIACCVAMWDAIEIAIWIATGSAIGISILDYNLGCNVNFLGGLRGLFFMIYIISSCDRLSRKWSSRGSKFSKASMLPRSLT